MARISSSLLCVPYVHILEAGVFLLEVKIDFADWAVAVLGHDDVGDAGLLFVALGAVLAVDEHYHVRILLDGAGFPEIGQLGLLVVARFDAAGELGKGDDRDPELARKPFEGAGDLAHHLHAVVDVRPAFDELEVVDDDEPQSAFRLEAAGFLFFVNQICVLYI